MFYSFRVIFVIFTLTVSSSLYGTEKIRIYAAASMTNVVMEVAKMYKQKTGHKVIPVFAGSSSLARQIENGAPADLYISANAKWVDYLIEKGVVKNNQSTIVAQNQLVLVKPVSSTVKPFPLSNSEAWVSLLKNERLAIGQPDSVPAGIYAKQALTFLGLWDKVKDNTAPTNSVRVALALVERAEAAAGIVYKTDAMVSKKVSIVGVFPIDSHEPIVYPMAILNDSPSVTALAEYLSSPQVKAIFVKNGFSPAK